MPLHTPVHIYFHNFISGYLTFFQGSPKACQLLFQVPVQNTCIYNRGCSFLSLTVSVCYRQAKQHFEAVFSQLFSSTSAFQRQHLKQSFTLYSSSLCAPCASFVLCSQPSSSETLPAVAGWAVHVPQVDLVATQAQARGMIRPHQALGEGGCLFFLGCFTSAAPQSGISEAAGFAICRQISDTSNNAL